MLEFRFQVDQINLARIALKRFFEIGHHLFEDRPDKRVPHKNYQGNIGEFKLANIAEDAFHALALPCSMLVESDVSRRDLMQIRNKFNPKHALERKIRGKQNDPSLTSPQIYKRKSLKVDVQARKRLLKHRGCGCIEAGIVNVFPAPMIQKVFRGN